MKWLKQFDYRICAKTTGWGEGETYYTDVLKSLVSQTLSNQECEEIWQKFPDTDSLIIPDHIVCFGNVLGNIINLLNLFFNLLNLNVGKDTCGGDSGSPLVFTTRNGEKLIHYIIGVNSWGARPCGSIHPSGFERVTSHLAFIKQHLVG